ncbi:MAG: hypothetical protein HYT03_02220 [Candidatus Harrisonbacteria bacterium]|nr:hypothetical protein [Candidatus Harrisonbacteria bacterium]
MVKVTLPETEYKQLKRQADAYKKMATKLFELAIKDPVENVVEDFRRTDLYTQEFLKDLESGLQKSSYIRNYGNKTPAKRS